MNRPIRKVAVALALLLAAIFINMNVVQVADNNSYDDTGKYADNRLPILAQYSSPRGHIDAQGTALAKSQATTDELKYLRQYANGAVYAPVVGFDSIIYGTDGIEAAEDKVLSGSDPRQFGRKIADLFTGRNPTGGNVELTLSKAAQEAAYSAMKGPNGQLRRGAVVALDPTTGKVLAAVSTPSYDPNKLSSHDTDGIEKYYAALQKDPAQPMLNRALNQLYPPGSVFKVIVSAAALKDGVKPTDQVPAPNSYWPFGGRSGPCNGNTGCIQNFGGETCQNGTTAQLIYAFAKSCNTAFAQLAVERVKGPAIASEAQKFGFDGNQLNIPLPVAKSTVGTKSDLDDPGSLAHSSFGQQDVRMTPLQGAMIAAAVANGGRLMTPYLVQQELSSNFSVLSSTTPSQLGQVLDTGQNQQLEQMMEAVVTAPEGTGQAAQISDIGGITVGGKTGTADTGIFHNGVQTPPHAWFCGFALVNGIPKIAVAVVIENGGVSGDETTGGLAAAPVAKAVMEAYLKSPQGR